MEISIKFPQLEEIKKHMMKLEKYMSVQSDQLALIEEQTTRIAQYIQDNMPSDKATQEAFAPVLEHLRAIGKAADPVPPLPDVIS